MHLSSMNGVTQAIAKRTLIFDTRSTDKYLADRSLLLQLFNQRKRSVATSDMASFDSMPGADRFHETETSVDQDTTETEAPETANENFRKLCNAIKTMLECIGEDPNRKDLLETPRRYAQALIDLTSGYKLDTHAIVGEALFHGAYTGMVVVKDIEVHSLCEHHLLPFLGKVYYHKHAALSFCVANS